MMGMKKKKNIIVLSVFMVVCYIVYQLYFFSTITSETGPFIAVDEHRQFKELKTEKIVIVRSTSDTHINDNGIIRGVLKKYMSMYRPNSNNEFRCLKTGDTIPFDHVNDDYCDCEDGTDEPSTSACTSATFYCDTQTSNKSISFIHIPSSQVNDGICDCCDGSDEWINETNSSMKRMLSQYDKHGYRKYVSQCPFKCK